jgi:hypothetical protein
LSVLTLITLTVPRCLQSAWLDEHGHQSLAEWHACYGESIAQLQSVHCSQYSQYTAGGGASMGSAPPSLPVRLTSSSLSAVSLRLLSLTSSSPSAVSLRLLSQVLVGLESCAGVCLCPFQPPLQVLRLQAAAQYMLLLRQAHARPCCSLSLWTCFKRVYYSSDRYPSHNRVAAAGCCTSQRTRRRGQRLT